MIKVFFGRKGMGKTKMLIGAANELSAEGQGEVIFIDDSDKLMYDLKHEVRFINVSEYPIEGASAFLGFLCGLIAENYDIKGVFIDGLSYIVKQSAGELSDFFTALNKLDERFKVQFYMSINGEPEAVPEYIKEYIC